MFVSNHAYKNLFCERAEIGKQTGLKILRVVTPLWVQVPPLAPKKNAMKLLILFLTIILVGKATFSENFDKDIEKFILNNPEVILKSLENYEIQREKEENEKVKKKLKTLKNLIYDDSNGLYAGKENSTISIVKFSDYNCSYCKKAHKDIVRIKKNFPKVKIIYKNFPILTPLSEKLARISYFIADDDNKKFNIFNDKILNSSGLLKESKVKDIVIDLGYDYQKVEDAIKKDSITNVLNQDLDLANKLELRGTPAFIIKDQIYFGYVGYDAIAESLKN